jgi:hypothetical protein
MPEANTLTTPPAVLVFVDHFGANVTLPGGVVRLSTMSEIPNSLGGAPILVAGPSLAMTIPHAQALIGLLQQVIAQAEELAKQAGQPN